MYRILIVEDDAITAKTLAAELKSWGYEAKIAEDYLHVDETVRSFAPHLILMDISLPVYNGFHWCNVLRKETNVPIVFVSSATDGMNIVTAIHHGADDFICKPYDARVLVAKVQALLRRSYDFQNTPLHTIAAGGVVLDVSALALYFGEETLELTRNEMKILQLLMAKKGRVVSRDEIMEVLWQADAFVDDNTLTVNMSRLRKRLETIGLTDFIETKKGLGYIVQR